MGKILVADDSSTIQKVVRITLANEPYQLVECMDEDELYKVIAVNDFNLVLLDFNLSNSKTGFQLGSDIKEKCPGAKVMAMLGTFDSVDHNELVNAGIDDSIVKPFESDVFIRKCRALMESSSDQSVDFPEVIEESLVVEEAPSNDDDLSNWEVNSPDVIGDVETSIPDTIEFPPVMESSNDPLAKELESWSMEVPGVIGGDDTGPELPPVIGGNEVEAESEPELELSVAPTDDDLELEEGHELDLDSTSSFDLSKFEEAYEQALPEEKDLAYPDNSNVEEMSEEEILAVGEDDPFEKMETEMVSLDDLEPDTIAEEEISLEVVPGNDLELERDIEDEISEDDIWAVDESTSSSEKPVEESGGGIETNYDLAEEVSFTVTDDNELTDEELEEEIINEGFDENLSLEVETPTAAIDTEEIVAMLKESLAPMIEKIVKEQCAEIIERVAWEVIPDLAENMIKKEIKNISDSLDD